MDTKEFRTYVESILSHMSRDVTRYDFNGIVLRVTESRETYFMATDGHRIACRHFDGAIHDMPAGDYCIPAESLAALKKFSPARSAPEPMFYDLGTLQAPNRKVALEVRSSDRAESMHSLVQRVAAERAKNAFVLRLSNEEAQDLSAHLRVLANHVGDDVVSFCVTSGNYLHAGTGAISSELPCVTAQRRAKLCTDISLNYELLTHDSGELRELGCWNPAYLADALETALRSSNGPSYVGVYFDSDPCEPCAVAPFVACTPCAPTEAKLNEACSLFMPMQP